MIVHRELPHKPFRGLFNETPLIEMWVISSVFCHKGCCSEGPDSSAAGLALEYSRAGLLGAGECTLGMATLHLHDITVVRVPMAALSDRSYLIGPQAPKVLFIFFIPVYFLCVVHIWSFLLFFLPAHWFFLLFFHSAIEFQLLYSSILKFPFGSSLYLLCLCWNFLLLSEVFCFILFFCLFLACSKMLSEAFLSWLL